MLSDSVFILFVIQSINEKLNEFTSVLFVLH